MAERDRLVLEVEAQWDALSSALVRFQTRLAEERGLTLSDLLAVDVIAREGTVCASELAEECGLTRGAITGMLGRLERAGMACCTRDEADARRLNISAVSEAARSDRRHATALRRLLRSFREDDLRVIQRFLSHTARVLDADG